MSNAQSARLMVAGNRNKSRAQVRHGALLTRVLLGTTALMAASATHAQSVLPQGAQVVAGNVAISGNAHSTTITQTTAKAIVNWDSFSVGQGDTVHFVQPDAQSAILNRVTGSATSTIAGQITGNGQVYLINPNGIAITSTGSVNVGGGFVASTLDIADDDFLKGKLSFRGKGTGLVSNAGSIAVARGGFAALLGGQVDNAGLISVPLGKIALGAGEAATLDFTGDGFLQVTLPSTASGNDALIKVAGSISGARIELRAATAVGAVRDAVNVTGMLMASGAHEENGAIVLDSGAGAVSVSGSLNATSTTGTGGRVQIGGDTIALTGASIDTSGATGGGSVTIGGGSRGASVTGLTTASDVTIDAASTIKADATQSGNGGAVTVWSNDQTSFGGTISARALGASGNGGSAEVSGHVLDYQGLTNLLAANGTAGTLLLDPYNITISSSADAGYSSWAATASGSNINTTTLQNALASANVTVSTGSSGSEAGNITVNSAISWSANTTLTLNAAGGVILNAGITNSGTSSGLTLTAAGTGGITSSTAGTISNSGALVLNASNASATSTLAGGISGTGSLASTSAGTLTLTGANTYTGATTVSSGTLQVSGSGVLGGGSYSGALSVASGANFIDTSSANQTFTNLAAGTGTITFSGTGSDIISGNQAFTGTLNLDQATTITGGSNGLQTGLGHAAAINVTGATVTLAGGDNSFVGYAPVATPVTINAGGKLYSSGTATYRLGSLTLNGGELASASPTGDALSYGSYALSSPVSVTANSTISAQNLNLAATGGTTFNLASGTTLAVTGTINHIPGNDTGLIETGSGTIVLSGTNAYTGATTVSSGTLQVSGSGVLGGGSYSGALSVASGANFIDTSSANQTFTNLAAGTGTVTLSGTGSDIISGNQAFTGTLNLNQATTITGGTNGSQTGLGHAAAINITGATVTLAAQTGYDNSFLGWASVTTPVTINAGGKLYSTGSATYTLGSLTLNGGELASTTAALTGDALLYGSFSLNGPVTVTANSTISAQNLSLNATGGTTFNLASSTTLAVTGAINHFSGGDTGLIESGTGTLTLTGTNTYTGATTVNGGTLQVSGSGVLGGGSYSGALSVASGANFIDTSSANQTFSNLAAGTGTITLSGTGSDIISGNQAFTGTLNLDQATTIIGGTNGSQTGLGHAAAINITGATVTLAGGDNSFVGWAPVATPVTINAGGKLYSSGTATYRLGSFTLNGGELASASPTGDALTYGSYVLSSPVAVTANSTISAQNLSLAATGGTTFNLASGTTLAVTGTINHIPGNDTGLIETGSGTIVLSGANTYNGATTVNGGTLQAGSTSAFGSNSATTIASGATLDLAGYSNTIGSLAGAGMVTDSGSAAAALTTGGLNASPTFSGVLQNGIGVLSLTKVGTGTLTLSGTNTYTGTTTVNGGTLQAGSTSAFGNNSATTIASGATLDLAGYSNTIGSLAGAGMVTDSGSAAAALTTGGLNASPTFSGVLQNGIGVLSLTKVGTGTLTLSGANTYTGATTVSSGTLQVSGSGVLGGGSYSSALSVASGANFIDTSGANQTFTNLAAGTGTITLGGTGSDIISGNQAFTGTLNLDQATTITGGSNGLQSGLGHAAAINITGATVTLAAQTGYDNSFVGWGAVTTPVTINAGGKLYSTGTASYRLGSLTLNGGELASTTSALTGDALTYGSYVLSSPVSVTANSTISTQNLNLAATGGTTFNLASGTTLAVTGTINHFSRGDTGLIEAGSGTIVLSGTNAYTGATTVNGGTLQAGSTSAFGNNSATTIASGATLDLAGYSNTIGSLAGAGTVTDSSASATLTTGSLNTSTTFSGVLQNGSGTISLTQSGSGTLTLSGANTYTGATTVSTGTLNLTGSWTPNTGTATVSVASGATLSGAGAITASTLSLSGTGAVSLTGSNAISTLTTSGTIGTLTLNDTAALSLDSVTTTGNLAITDSSAITVASGATIAGTGSGNLALTTTGSGSIINSGTISQAGTGAITLAVANGTLSNTGSIIGSPTAGAISLAATGTGVIADGAGTITQAGTGTISLTSAGTLAADTITYTNAAANTLTIDGSGITTVGHNITSTGGALATSISGASITLDPTINTNNGNLTFNGPVVQSGNNTLIAGTGTITFTSTVDGAYAMTASAANFSLGGAWGSSTPLGAVSLTSTNSLTLPSISATSVVAQVTGGNLTLASGSQIAATNSGTAVVLAASGAFINDSGASAITASNGQWQIYSANPTGDTFGSLNSGNTAVWGAIYGSTISQTGNRYIFATSPTLTVSSASTSKTYGTNATSAVAASYTVSGYNTGVAGAYLADTFASSLTGAPSVTSSGAAASANAGSYAITAAAGTLSATSGYTLAYSSPGTLTVNPAALTVTYTATPTSSTYGAALSSVTGTAAATGLANGDTLASLGTANWTTAATTGANAGSYAITGAGLASSNYTINAVQAAGNATAYTINPAALTIAANSASKTYDATAWSGGNGVTITGLVNGDTNASLTGTLTYGGTAQGATNAGSYTLSASGLSNANYTIAYTNGSLAIGKAALTLTGANTSATYTSAAHTNAPATLSGLKGSDNFTISGYATGTNAGTYTDALALTAQGSTLASNYTLTTTNGSLTIGKAALTIAGATGTTTYNGATQTNAYTTTGLLGSDTVTSVTGRASGTNAGTYTDALSGATGTGLANYTIAYTNGSLAIGKAALTVTYTATPTSSTYGAALSSVSGTAAATGLANGDTLASLGTANWTTSATTGANAGSYAITGAGLASSNYTINAVQAAGNATAYTINPAALTIAANSASKTYDATAWSGGNGVTITGLVNGDTNASLTGTLTYGGTAQGATNAGSYTLSASGLSNANYTISYANGSFTIGKAALTIAGATSTTTYNGAAQTNAYTATGLLGSDTVTAVTGRATGTNAGTYTDTLTGATGTGLANYTIAYTNGSLVIGKAALTLTGANTSATYTSATQTNAPATLTGLKGSDSFTITGLATGTNAGTYTDALALTAQGATLASNYALTTSNGSLTIAKAALAITGATTATTYNDATQTNSFTTSGLLGSDTVTAVNGLASGTNAGTYADVLSGATGSGLGNYAISYTNGSLAIGKAPLTLTGATTSATYTAAAQTNAPATLSGLKGSDSFTITGLASGTNAGTYADNLALVAQGGTLASNYTLTTSNGSLTIAKAALSITGATTATTYNGAAQTNGFTTSGLLGSDTVTGVSGLASGTNAGTYADALLNATGSGIGNYAISYTNGSLTIGKAALTLTYAANPASSIFGTPLAPLSGIVSGSGFMGSDGVSKLSGTIIWRTTAKQGANIGSYAIIGSGLTSANYSITANQAAGDVSAYTIVPVAITPWPSLYVVTGMSSYEPITRMLFDEAARTLPRCLTGGTAKGHSPNMACSMFVAVN